MLPLCPECNTRMRILVGRENNRYWCPKCNRIYRNYEIND